jgi:hypothetical protein
VTKSRVSALSSITMLSSYIRLDLLSSQFQISFHVKVFYVFLVSLILTTCPTYHYFIGSITLTALANLHKSLSLALCKILNYPLIPYLFGPMIFLVMLMIYTPSSK